MNQQNHKTCGKLIICVVREGHGDRVVAVTRENGAKGGTIVPGRGKSDNPLVDFLCIGDHREEVVLTLVNGEEVASVINALKAHGRDTQKGSRGMGILLNVPRIDVYKRQLQGRTGRCCRSSRPVVRGRGRRSCRDERDSNPA